MFSFKTFQTKLFLTYSIFLVIFTLMITIPMYVYLKRTTETNIIFSVQQSLTSITESLDMFANQYENITSQLYLKKDDSIYNNSAIQWLQNLSLSANEADTLKANNSIDASLALLAEIYKNMYRITIFNEQGLFFSNKPFDRPVNNALRKEEEWLKKPLQAKGAAVLEYADHDPWLSEDRTPVYSFIRLLTVNGIHVGYLEMQIRADKLIAPDKLTGIPGASLSLFDDTDILFSNATSKGSNNEQIPIYRSIASHSKFGIQSIDNHGKKESALYRLSEKTGYTALYAISEDILYAPLRIFRNVSLSAVLFLIALSMLVFYLLSRALTYPIKKLKKMIDTIDLDDTNVKMNNEFKMDEIELLNRSFRKMNLRLQASLEEIVQFRTMQLQSHFEVLQAQINPHFLFNMLGVITILSEEEQNAQAANVCRKLASFLRYTIIQTNPITTVEHEMNFAHDYLALMKTRYAHRLQFKVELPEEMKRISIPKLTLQPLVENSINHGFQGTLHGLIVTIRGQIEANRWYITISDNGNGIPPDALASLHEKIETYGEHLDSLQKKEQLTLGGMGILSTFARIKLHYKDRVEFKIGNNPEHGAFIVISGCIEDYGDKEGII
ncbi:sensor histidine kinase [Paenibacillus sp. GCM10027628]|uniref:sensor histidine kinase n=1 Tax=Paenibacillus sp. GCM10027628 TaxID=3273413 RepID=UPI003624EA80